MINLKEIQKFKFVPILGKISPLKPIFRKYFKKIAQPSKCKIMYKKNTLVDSDIILFFTSKENRRFCQLKNILHFLKSINIKKSIKFSYCREAGDLIENLTLKENLYLEAFSSSLSSSKDFQLKNYLTKNGNKDLANLFKKAGNLERYPHDANEEEKKTVGLIKSLLVDADFLIYEKPEKYLSDETFDSFLNAMKYLSKMKGKIIIIHPEKDCLWTNHITKIATQAQNKQYVIGSVPSIGEALSDHLSKLLSNGNTPLKKSIATSDILLFNNIPDIDEEAA